MGSADHAHAVVSRYLHIFRVAGGVRCPPMVAGAVNLYYTSTTVCRKYNVCLSCAESRF